MLDKPKSFWPLDVDFVDFGLKTPRRTTHIAKSDIGMMEIPVFDSAVLAPIPILAICRPVTEPWQTSCVRRQA
jgi:hypothetical protein